MPTSIVRCFVAANAAIWLAMAAGTGAEGDPLAAIEKRFKQLDRDGDGRLSLAEAKPVEQWVKGADADGDGFFTSEEVTGFLRERVAQMIAARRGAGTPDSTPIDAQAPPMLEASADSPREAPRRLKASECGVGRLIPDATLTDLDGQPQRVSELLGGKPAVVALVSTSCPVSKRSLPALARLETEYTARGVSFVLLAPTATDTPEELRAALQTAGLRAPCLRDAGNAFLAGLGARASTDTFLLDAAQTLTYRGALDDQYGLGYAREAPLNRYLASALEAVLAGRQPLIAATEAPGCVLDLGEVKTAASDITYHNRVSRIVQANCLECHRAGGIAPFALETPEQVVAKSGMIRKMVERGLMPPWFAAPPAPGSHSPWGNDRTLAARDKADLLAWLAAGKPLGESEDAPLTRAFPAEWAIGQPDLIVQLPTPIDVKAEGTMSYKNVTVETTLTEDKWVRGLEIRPTAREVVHHVLVFAQEPGKTRFMGEEDERDGFFAAYVPGNSHALYPDGFAKKLPAGAKLRFQIHYTPNGTATQDQMRLGLIFAAEAPRHVIRVAGIANHRLSIPPGAKHHPATSVLPVPAEVKLLAFTPHMHLRGAAFRYEAILPDGAIRTLLDVPRYDFNWQLSYRYAEPLTLPAGAQIRATGWFDNSAENPANPDPAKTVRWGQQTFDEMMLGYVEYYVPGEAGTVKTAAR